MNLSPKQIETKIKIEFFASLLNVPPAWAVAIAMVESSLGLHQKSPTGCLGVFQMSTIAMKDLLQTMEMNDDDLIDIICGIAFLRLLLRRWKSVEAATKHYCDPAEKDAYFEKVKAYMRGES